MIVVLPDEKSLSLSMRLRLKYWLTIALLLFSVAESAAMKYRFRYYTDTNGLSSNTIQCIYQDSKGYIWIGTADGLDRFNSNEFINFRTDYSRQHLLENDCIYAICGDPDESRRLWVGTGDGLFIYDSADNSFTRLPVVCDGREYRNLLVWTLVPDGCGGIWIGTLGAGAFRCDLLTGQFDHFDAASHPQAFASNIVTGILADRDNNIWIACENRISRYNPENGIFFTFRVEDARQQVSLSRISSMCQDTFGNIWIGGFNSEFFKFEPSQLTFSAHRPVGSGYGRIRCIIEESPGMLMLGTESGLVNFDMANRDFNLIDDGTLNQNGHLNDKFIHSILKDRDGGIWVGTYFGGINYLSPYSVLFTSLERGPDCGRVISRFCEDADGHIWIGSDDGGLSRYDPRTERYEKIEIDPENPSLNIHALLVDGDDLWVGTYGDGLYRVDKRNGSVRRYTAREIPLDNLDVYSLYRDTHGRLWIGTKRGICRYDDASDLIECLYELEYNSDVVDICEDLNGDLWFATQGHGLLFYNYSTGLFLAFSEKSERGTSPPHKINCLAIGGNNLWIGTHGNGLYRYDTAHGTLVNVFENSIFTRSSVFQIIQTGDELWMTTNYGLLRYNYNDARCPTYIYTSEDGLLANIFNANSGFKSLSGHIYLGCKNGVNKFYPYDFLHIRQKPAPDVVFCNVRLFGHDAHAAPTASAIDASRSIVIRSRKGGFTLDFTALNYPSPYRTIYRYKLEPLDTEWITTGLDDRQGLQRVSYTNLYPGRYRFRVCASNNGNEFGRESSVEVQVQAPWWATGKMQLLYAILLLLFIGAAIFRWRHYVIRKHRMQIAAIAHRSNVELMQDQLDFYAGTLAEVQSPLSLISAMSATLSANGSLPTNLHEDVRQIQSIIERLKALLNRALNANSRNKDAVAVDGTEPVVQWTDEMPQTVATAACEAMDIVTNDSTKALQILLVESDADYADFCKRHLSHYHTIHSICDIPTALQMLRTRAISAVICDAGTTGTEGIELCKTIRTEPYIGDIPVILLSAAANERLKLQALQAGADVLLDKGVTMAHLDMQVRMLVESRDKLRIKYSRQPYVQLGQSDDAQSANRFLEKVNRYIEDHISDSEITVEDIAAAVKVSRTQLFTRIKQLTGTTPNEFLRSMRLKMAAELLAAENDLRVSEICYMTGFTSTSYFAKCFRRQFGMLPNRYMELHRPQSERTARL